MTNLVEEKEPEIIYVKCRGEIVEAPFSYLSRIDKFRTEYEITKNLNFTLKDCSKYTFNLYLDYLRDVPYKKGNKIPFKLKFIYDYLNTDCEQMNNEREKEKEQRRQEIMYDLKRQLDKDSMFNIDEELISSPTMTFGLSLSLNEDEYKSYKDDIDKLILSRQWAKQLDSYTISNRNCKKHMTLIVYNDIKGINIDRAKTDFFNCNECE